MPFPRRTAALAVVASVASVIASPTAVAQCGQSDGNAANEVLAGIARARGNAGMTAHRDDARLTRIAQRHARRMARSASIWHDNLAGWANGRAVAQNVAFADSGAGTVRVMMASGPHRANILSRRYRFIGVGAARACNGLVMVSVDFQSAG